MTTTREKSDDELKAAVVDELAWTPSVNSAHIGVTVDQGAVTLTGAVDTYPERLLAEKAALRVHGVSAVAGELTVKNIWSTTTNDADIARVAGAALDGAVDVPSESVKAMVRDHDVTLSGEVTWQYQRQAAERTVQYLKGVRQVHNMVTVTPTVSTIDLKAAIGEALVRSATLEANRITVTHHAGVVTLDGTVHSWTERREANRAAWSGPGVTGVVNHLQIIN